MDAGDNTIRCETPSNEPSESVISLLALTKYGYEYTVYCIQDDFSLMYHYHCVTAFCDIIYGDIY